LVKDLAARNTENGDFVESRESLGEGMLVEDIPFSVLNYEDNAQGELWRRL
jgi:hypothetical protein